MKRLTSTLPLLALFACLSSCHKNEAPPPEKEPPKEVSSAAPSASVASVERPGPKATPTLVLEEWKPADGSKPDGVYAVEGAIMVTQKNRVGKIAGDTVQWLKETIVAEKYGHPSVIEAVAGRYPDEIDVVYSSDNLRAPVPSYVPLTGKGHPASFATGGGPAGYVHVARVGESVMMSGWSYTEGIQLVSVRGPKLERKQQSPSEAGCKPGEVESNEWFRYKPAIWLGPIASTQTGMLVGVGNLCEKRGPALEVWEDSAKSTIIDISSTVKDIGWWPKLLGGKDRVWLFAVKKQPIVQYKKGEVLALPRTEAPATFAFVSTSGALHVVAGPSLLRLEEGKWEEVGKLSWPTLFHTFVIDGDAMWASAEGKVYRVREGKGWSFGDDCKTPFVYLYEVSPGNANNFNFPGTRKALATLPDAADIKLVEIREGGRRLGVIVKNKEQGEAVIAHVKATMPDESPMLICHAPTSTRVIELNGGK